MLIKFFGPTLFLAQITGTLCVLSIVSIVRSAAGASQICVCYRDWQRAIWNANVLFEDT